MIQVVDVTKALGPDCVLKDVSLKLSEGSLVCLRGANGSGKTMLLRVIAGLMLADEGGVLMDGKRLGHDIEFPPSMGLLIEHPAFVEGLSGWRNLSLLASLKGTIGDDEVREAIARVGLDPEDNRPVRKYSLGMRQRLGIAAAVMERPELILLDEPFNGLDGSGVVLAMDILAEERERGACVVVACHGMEEFERMADEVVTLVRGCVMPRAAVRPGPVRASVQHPERGGR